MLPAAYLFRTMAAAHRADALRADRQAEMFDDGSPDGCRLAGRARSLRTAAALLDLTAAVTV